MKPKHRKSFYQNSKPRKSENRNSKPQNPKSQNLKLRNPIYPIPQRLKTQNPKNCLNENIDHKLSEKFQVAHWTCTSGKFIYHSYSPPHPVTILKAALNFTTFQDFFNIFSNFVVLKFGKLGVQKFGILGFRIG